MLLHGFHAGVETLARPNAWRGVKREVWRPLGHSRRADADILRGIPAPRHVPRSTGGVPAFFCAVIFTHQSVMVIAKAISQHVSGCATCDVRRATWGTKHSTHRRFITGRRSTSAQRLVCQPRTSHVARRTAVNKCERHAEACRPPRATTLRSPVTLLRFHGHGLDTVLGFAGIGVTDRSGGLGDEGDQLVLVVHLFGHRALAGEHQFLPPGGEL